MQTNMQAMAPGKYVFSLPEPAKINHLVLCTSEPFQDGLGATIYYSTARLQAAGAPWQFLGYLSNDKPSAVFRVRQQPADGDAMSTDDDLGELGISLEPLAAIQALATERALVAADRLAPNTSLVQRLAEHAFNFLSSFAKPAYQYGEEQAVPLKGLHDWYSAVLRKAENDPGWLK